MEHVRSRIEGKVGIIELHNPPHQFMTSRMVRELDLIVMMYPPLAKVRYEDLGKVFRSTGAAAVARAELDRGSSFDVWARHGVLARQAGLLPGKRQRGTGDVHAKPIWVEAQSPLLARSPGQ